MRHLFIKIEVLAETNIKTAIEEGIDLAKRLETNIAFDFNGTECYMSGDSYPESVFEAWLKDGDNYRFKE